jgi:hypothetical protein
MPSASDHQPSVPAKKARSRPARGGAALAWGVLFFAGVQLGLGILMDRWQPELCDPEYGSKWARLRARRAEKPDRPLLVVLGSSRSNLGFRPAVLSDYRPRTGPAPLVFNFALNGAGPLLELLCLRRLLHDGVRPDWAVIEVHPALLNQERGWSEAAALNVNRLRWVDMPAVARYADRPSLLVRRWCRSRLAPCYTHRFCILTRYAPDLLPESQADELRRLDGFGWNQYERDGVNAERYRRGVAYARREYAAALARFQVSPAPDRALRELLALCRDRGIVAFLLLMPEGSEFRGWYPPAARSRIDEYLDGVSRAYGAPLIDARCWLDDRCFFDSHHLLPGGSTAFTRRFGREVLRPLLEGRLPAGSVRSAEDRKGTRWPSPVPDAPAP